MDREKITTTTRSRSDLANDFLDVDVQERANGIKGLTAVLVCAAHGRLDIERDGEDPPVTPEWFGRGLTVLVDRINEELEAIVHAVEKSQSVR